MPATGAARQKILIVTRNLPPLVGGMERLNWHMADELARYADVRVIGPMGSAALAPTGVEVREVPLRPLWKFLWRARALACSEARRWQPDIVLAGSGLTAPLARVAARACSAQAAVYVHGLDVAVKHPVYRAIWMPALRRMDRVIANSRATEKLCRDIGVDPMRIGIVHPGVDLPADEGPTPPQAKINVAASDSLFFRERGSDESMDSRGTAGIAFRQRHNLGNRPLLLSVGRLTTRKGLREFVTQSLPQIVAAHPDVMLLIVGEAPRDALHARAQLPDSIQAAADAAGIGNNLMFLGVITDDAELGNIYRAGDVHVFPVRNIAGDPEGFGMVAVEAAAHGLPTVAFATGGIVDAVAEAKSGYLVTPGDYATFAEIVAKTLRERGSLRDSCATFAIQFAWPTFGENVARQWSVLGRNPSGDCTSQ